jgi:hypothetical protein
LLLACPFFIVCCRTNNGTVEEVKPDEITNVLESMTNIMIHDVTNPPLASRFFSYASLAGYEVVTQNNSSFKSMHGVLKDYPVIKKPAIKNYSSKLAALFAMLKTAEKLQPSGSLLQSTEQDLREKSIATGVSADKRPAEIHAETRSKLLVSYAACLYSCC